MAKRTVDTYKILRDKILSGEFRPAQRLTEAKVVEELGVSRNHVRMAFQRLVADGLIDLQPNQGAAVTDVTLESILDVFVAREALELEAYRRAFSRMTKGNLAKLEELIEKMRTAIDENDFDLYSSSAINFRVLILDISDSPHLRQLADSLLLITGRVVLRKVMIPLRGKSSLAEHEALLNALKGNNLGGIDTAFRRHMANLKADIEQYWDIIRP
ncbi:MAG: GntR family transcriptional regulator [Anaerolineae bacterium]|nr:GntR family transcriptional regulator [Anaerolineae bacterium]